MTGMEFKVRDDPALGQAVRHYRIACAHGSSSAVLLPGRKPLADLVVLDLMMAGHHSKQRCKCVPAMPAFSTEFRA